MAADKQLSDLKRAYQTLNVPACATTTSIKKAYRQLLKRWHPDLYSRGASMSAEATQMTRLINEAYSTIRQAPLRYYSEGPSQARAVRRENGRNNATVARSLEPLPASGAERVGARARFKPALSTAKQLVDPRNISLAVRRPAGAVRVGCVKQARSHDTRPEIIVDQDARRAHEVVDEGTSAGAIGTVHQHHGQPVGQLEHAPFFLIEPSRLRELEQSGQCLAEVVGLHRAIRDRARRGGRP